jgi:hypothetical protein
LLGNGSVKIPLPLLGKGPVKIPLSFLGNGSVKIPLIVARQQLGINVTAATNTHATIEELLDQSFSMWPVSYEGKYAISSSHNFLYFTQIWQRKISLNVSSSNTLAQTVPVKKKVSRFIPP